MAELPTSLVRAMGYPISHKRPRPNPKLAALRPRRTPMMNRMLWFQASRQSDKLLPLVLRGHSRAVRETARYLTGRRPPRDLL